MKLLECTLLFKSPTWKHPTARPGAGCCSPRASGFSRPPPRPPRPPPAPNKGARPPHTPPPCHLPPRGAHKLPSELTSRGPASLGSAAHDAKLQQGPPGLLAGGRGPSPGGPQAEAPRKAGTQHPSSAPTGHVGQNSELSSPPGQSAATLWFRSAARPLPRPSSAPAPHSSRRSHSNRQRPASFGHANGQRGRRGGAGPLALCLRRLGWAGDCVSASGEP